MLRSTHLNKLFNSHQSLRRRRAVRIAETLEDRCMLSAGVIVREYGTSPGPDPQSGNMEYHEFWVGTYNSSLNDVQWANYEEAIPIGSDFAQAGDFDGDGYSDVISSVGTVAFNLSPVFNSDFGLITDTGVSFSGTAPQMQMEQDGGGYFIGDFNGDGADDLGLLTSTSGGASFQIALSTGQRTTPIFSTPTDWGTDFDLRSGWFRVGDFDGDGDEDIIGRSEDNWTFWRSTGSSFVQITGPDEHLPDPGEDLRIGNFFGSNDGLEVAILDRTGRGTNYPMADTNYAHWYLWKPGSSNIFYSGATWIQSTPTGPASYQEHALQNIRVGDFDGNGYDDIFGRHETGNMDIMFSDGLGNLTKTAAGNFMHGVVGGYNDSGNWNPDNGYGIAVNMGVFVGDFDDDGAAEIMWIDRTNTGSGGGSGGGSGSGGGGGGGKAHHEVWFSQWTGSTLQTTQMSDFVEDSFVWFDGGHREDGNSGFVLV